MEWGGGVKEKLYFNLVDKQSFKDIFSFSKCSKHRDVAFCTSERKMNEYTTGEEKGGKLCKFSYIMLEFSKQRVLWKEMWMKDENSRFFFFFFISFFFKECMPLLFACIAIANDVFGIVFYFRGLETCSCMTIVLCGMEFPRNILVSMFWLINYV